MAERRMFAKTIIDSDIFLEMPQSTQNLYFHLAMRADDDGFINNPKAIMRSIGCREDDIKILISKQFLIPFESGVVVIKHWKIHNYIRSDRYNETKCQAEKKTLLLDENNSYFQDGIPMVAERLPDGIPVVDEMDTQDRLGKDRLGKDSKDKECGDKPHRSTKFTPPTLEEVKTYCEERSNGIDAQYFIDFYTSKNWLVGKTKMKDWKASVRTWEKRQKEYGGGNNGTVQGNKEPTKRGAFSEYSGTVL
ncbi:MAG: replisome organizer [Anaerotignaceae bacterium]